MEEHQTSSAWIYAKHCMLSHMTALSVIWRDMDLMD